MYSKIILSKFDDTYSTFYIIINVSNDTFKVHFTTIDYINSQYYDKIITLTLSIIYENYNLILIIFLHCFNFPSFI